ncbi:hypothetical protein C2U72_16780 [Prosthecomicrobium hirschii]|uniref:LPS export ABC transporter periplasmic protein LptC n=1 Tax=Prosthecodimorpha hirschii TaxID=665126 RepID=UPI001129EB0B|nr:LPS export ABC transporter periplasmic protein LptC [Prosthecomicrobium hirschii]TPQ49782.1 hypothetical protein C2U72_16780 [Prosthecomicrobium hirschii]
MLKRPPRPHAETPPDDVRAATGRFAATERRAARRHSTLVRLLKVVLPILALGVAGVVGLRVFLFSFAPDLKLPTVLFSRDGLTMVEPHLSGRSKDRAYEVTALRAVQNLTDTKKVRLEKVSARIELADRQWAKVAAEGGLYDGGQETLRLEQGLVVTTSNGYRAATDGADFDLKSGRIVSRGAVRLEGPAATIESETLEIADNGHSFLFTGRVRLDLRPAESDRSSPAAATRPNGSERMAGSDGTSRSLPQ